MRVFTDPTANSLARGSRPKSGIVTAIFLLLASLLLPAHADSLQEIIQGGVLRHLGIPYANFVTGFGTGMDVELVQGFARKLGLRYEYVETDWDRIFGDLTGQEVSYRNGELVRGKAVPVRGDIAANGITVLDWRTEVVTFSRPTFVNQVWLVCRNDSEIQPIAGTGSVDRDIKQTKAFLKDRSVLCKTGTCLAPELYDIAATGAIIRLFSGALNDIAPAMLQGEAELTLLDVPDALVGMMNWPGQIKILGPVCPQQTMAAAFAPGNTGLRDAFNAYLGELVDNGEFLRIVQKYYPYALDFFGDFFSARTLSRQ